MEWGTKVPEKAALIFDGADRAAKSLALLYGRRESDSDTTTNSGSSSTVTVPKHVVAQITHGLLESARGSVLSVSPWILPC
jgi:hypothetical protein